MPGRIMDLSHRAAEMLGYVNNGKAQIKAEFVGRAPLEGDDTRMLLASYSGPPVESNTRYADGTNSIADMAGNFFGGLFSYADTTPQEQDAAIGTAHAAVTAMANQPADLRDWAQSVDMNARMVDLPLGVYAEQSNAVEIAKRFAILGSVKEEQVTANGGPATRLSLTYLKPGVLPDDVQTMAQELGLDGIVLYN
jgi:rare lipoprotein A